jgi:hypothetical protein
MSMSPAYHLLGKAMQGEKLNENQVKNIIGVVRKDERQRIVKLLDSYLDFHPNLGICDLKSGHQLEPNHVIRLIKGDWK